MSRDETVTLVPKVPEPQVIATPDTHRRGRQGFTLLELLLVLALLVIVAALAVPALQGTMVNQRLRSAGDLLRSQMAKARVRAMKTGRTHAMWIEPEGARYRIEPWMTGDEALEGNTAAAAVGGLAGGGAPASDPNLLITEEQLPEGVVFYVAETVQDNRAMLAQQSTASASGATLGDAPPIIFYPDGTTSSARVAVTDGQGLFVLVSLRGLTGIALVTDPLTEQELAYQ